jgi:predicted RNA-binding Zn-ribbon protein involved in translation (DUF1610 family)
MSEPSPPPARDVPPKSTLFCPECGHRSPSDGDWTLAESTRETRYRCPDCDVVVTSRRSFDADDRPARSPERWHATLQTWEEGVRTLQQFWKRTFSLS